MKTDTLTYQEKEATANKAKAKSEAAIAKKAENPVQLIKKTKRPVYEEEIENAIDELNPDENSMESRG